MSQYRELETLQYMGSKSRILSHICEPIIKNTKIKKVVDLFAGTGSVGYALKDSKNIVSNDIEYYSYVLNQAILNGCNLSSALEREFVSSVHSNYSIISSSVQDAIEAEKLFFLSEPDYKEYKEFCEQTPSVFNPETLDKRLRSVGDLVRKIVPGAKPEVDFHCLFLTYYANAYFGITQCCQIDAIRESISSIEDVNVQNVLLAVLMSVMSSVASTTTHFAQYLKVKSKSTCRNLIAKRKSNIIEEFFTLLGEYRLAGLCSSDYKHSLCFNLDFVDCLNQISLDEQTLVYADPPYFKEHYSRYYHVLNTLCLYDYPSMSINPQTKEYSIGRYREERCISDFGKKAKALSAFECLINKCADAKAWLMISYSDNSIVAISDLENLAQQKYDLLIEKIELNHSKQGRASTSKVEEYIFICRPKESVSSAEGKLNVIKDLKPIVDNPAGLMHNYMARKPYNIVAELIKRFSPEGGCVFDPMFGSGTTIIESSKQGRYVIGTDINILAYKLCHASLTKWDLERVASLIDTFCQKIKIACESIYTINIEEEVRILERCHFNQIDGALVPVAYWYKTIKNGKLSGRKKEMVSSTFINEYNSFGYLHTRNIPNFSLIPNSRIAIGSEDTVHTYFCNRNLLAMDSIIGQLEKYKGEYGYEILEVLVSSAVNLIKLSDKKASSQIPYWLPKVNVTSRNAVIVIEQKAKAFKEGLFFLGEKCQSFIDKSSLDSRRVVLENTPAQFVSKEILPDNSVDLVLTDPPYTDQVPYLEYSQLWYRVMGWDGFTDETLKAELVVSNAPSRNKNICNFNAIFSAIIDRISPALKDNGYFIMFYHTFDLKSWSYILSLMKAHGLVYCAEIPSAAPRKSFKTVMSPKSTLDGNFIIVFQKKSAREDTVFDGSIKEAENAAIESARKIISERTAVTSQDLYDYGMLKDAFELGYLEILAEKHTSFIDVIADEFVYDNGLWREKICTGC